MKVDPHLVERLARLAGLHVEDAEIEVLRPRLEAMFSILDTVTSETGDERRAERDETAEGGVVRPDDVSPSFPVADALGNAPARAGDHFDVPASFEEPR